MKKYIYGWISVLAIVIMLCTGLLDFGWYHPDKVQAAGYTNQIRYCDASSYFYSSYGVWTTVTHQDSAASTTQNVLQMGYMASSTSNWYRTHSSIMRFTVNATPDISLITDIKIRLWCVVKQVTGTPTFQAPYFSLYDTSAGINNTIDAPDIDQFNDGQVKNRISNYYYWDSLSAGAWIEFTIAPVDWLSLLTPDSGIYSHVALVSEQQALDNIPNGLWNSSTGYVATFYGNTNNIAEMIISYAASAEVPDFDYHENAPVDNVTMGDEVADNITLSTLSCMYANENLEYDIEGDSGAPIVLRLVNTSGATIASLTDSIRTNGHYYWQIDSLAETYAGFVQAKENTYGLSSDWVCIQPQVDASQENLNIYSVKTEYPQYTKPFDTYVVNRGSLMYVHWKTNIDGDSDNLTDITLDIYNNGDNVTKAYSHSFESLATDYYKGTDNNTYRGLNWRFAVFTPKTLTTTNTYGGLVQNLGLDFVPDNKGYLQPMINSGDDGEITITHSAYWYLTSAADGIAIELLQSQFATDEEIGFKVTIGRESNVETDLQYMIARVIEVGNNVATSVSEGENVFYIDAIESEGDYTLEVKLYNTGISSYEYIYQIPFTVSDTAAPPTTPPKPTDITDWLTDLLHRWHLDTTGGHWLLILIGMGTFLIIGNKVKHSTIGLVGALLVFALGIVVGWIDLWWIVLLALGAGFTVWQYIRSKASGSGAG